MELATRSPGQEKALSYLRALVGQRRSGRHVRLPTVVELARLASVAPATMWKAIQRLKADGLVRVSKSRGVEVTPAGGSGCEQDRLSEVVHERSSLQKWEWLCLRIEKDILTGLFSPGTVMPSPKELGARYGVCFRTLKKSLSALVYRDVVTPFKKGYRVPALSSGARHSAVTVISRFAPPRSVLLLTSRMQEHYRVLESICGKQNLNLGFHSLLQPSAARPGGAPLGIADDDSVFGYLIWPAGMSMEELGHLCRQVAQTRKPVSFLDETGEIQLAGLRAQSGRFRFFSLANSASAARSMARYLINRGHRRIAYLSPFQGMLWSQNRLEGLRATFEAAGISDGVVDCTVALDVQRTAYLRACDRFLSTVRVLPSLGRSLEGANGENLQREIAGFRRVVDRIVGPANLRSISRPLFDKALGYPDVTAWVGANDYMAVEAVDFLADKGIAVPGDISLAGFDDTLEAFLRNITSYNFNIPAVTQAMLAHVLDAGAKRSRPSSVDIVEVDGFISSRLSVAKR